VPLRLGRQGEEEGGLESARKPSCPQTYCSVHFPRKFAFAFGYLPALVLSAASVIAKPDTKVPSAFDPEEDSWQDVKGLDVL